MKKREVFNGRRSQVTIFIIIALIIVAGAISYFVITGKFNLKNILPQKFPEVTEIIESCIENATYEGIYFIGLQGGYYDVPNPYIAYSLLKIPIYLDGADKKIISQSILESELTKAVNNNLGYCLSDFSKEYEKLGYSITLGSTNSLKATIKGKQVQTSIELPIIIKKGEENAAMSDFSKTISFDLAGKYNITRDFVTEQAKNPAELQTEYLLESSIKNNFKVETIQLEDNLKIYTFIFDEVYNGRPFAYTFGVKS